MRGFWGGLLLFLLPFCSRGVDADEIDLETLLIGIQHHDALLQTAQGNLESWYFVSDYHRTLNPIDGGASYGEGKWEVAFAFDSTRIRSDVRSEIFANEVRIWDGEKQIDIDYSGSSPGIAIRGDMVIEFSSLPRYWVTYNNRMDKGIYSLGKYLEQYESECQLVGQEAFHDVLCYVISVKGWTTTTKKFWIAPSKGYRLVKYEAILRTGEAFNRVVGITDYKEVEDGVWFPKSGERIFYMWDKVQKIERLWTKTTMELKTVEVNIDVSEQFNLNLPPGSEVWDHRTQSVRTLKEVWP